MTTFLFIENINFLVAGFWVWRQRLYTLKILSLCLLSQTRQNLLPSFSNLQSEISNCPHNVVGLHIHGIMYIIKALQRIRMVTNTEVDGRINWVIDLEPLKALG